MNTPVPAHVTESLRRISRGDEFQAFVMYLRGSLEDAKSTLVRADADRFQRLQGYAQALTDVLELVDPKSGRTTGKPHP